MYIICPAQSLIDYPRTACNRVDTNRSSNQSTPQSNHHDPPTVGSERSSSHLKVATMQNSGSSSGGGVRKTSPGPPPGGGSSDRNVQQDSLRQMGHPAVWPTVKNHINTSLALVKNLTDLTQELSQMYDHHAEELQLLVANYRKKNAELRKDRPGANCMLEVWESMLQGVEADSASHSEVAAVLSRQVSRQTLERSFFRKLQARKLLQHRESLDAIVTKAEDHLAKCRQDYKVAYTGACASPNSTNAQAAYLDAHNTYVTQLHATNAIVDTYAKETLPDILQELEDVYGDLCKTMAESLAVGAEILSNRMGAQSRRWCTLWSECKAVEPSRDTTSLIKSANVPSQPHPSHRLRLFTPPQPMEPQETKNPMDSSSAPLLRNELVQDRLASLQAGQRYDSLCEESNQLTLQIQQLQDSLATMARLQQRSLESQLFNKANEIQEDISKKRYELRTVQLNFAANRAQRELFSTKLDNVDGGSAPPTDRKMSSASSISMKSKWLKAFKSLKTPPPNGSSKDVEKDKTNQMYHAVSTIIALRRDDGKVVAPSDSMHQFQEYTYKKITPCDVCSQVLRGHTRQGLKCRICKLNVHIDCQERVGKCQAKSRLLRRQKSSSEIETRVTPPQVNQPPTPHSNSDIEQGDDTPDPRQLSPDFMIKPQKSPDNDKYLPETISPSEQAVRSRSVTFRTPPTDTDSLDYGAGNQPRRRHHVFGMKKFMFGHRSHERAASLPETEESSYGARERPFGQPLVLGASSSSVDPETPPPQLPIVANSIHHDRHHKRHH